MSATYLFDLGDLSPACDADLMEVMAARGMKCTPVLSGDEQVLNRKAVAVMLTHDTVLVPDDVARHTPAVSNAMRIARSLGLQVEPLRKHLRNEATNPAPVSAAQQAWQLAGAGNSSAHARPLRTLPWTEDRAPGRATGCRFGGSPRER